MTSVVCWVAEEDSHPRMWVAADSRISTTNGHESHSILLDVFPKISAIPLKIATRPELSMFPREVASIGFALAGSTLFASAIKDVLAFMLSSLRPLIKTDANRSDDDGGIADEFFDWNRLHPLNSELRRQLPSFNQIADLTVDIVRQVLLSNRISQGVSSASSALMLFGYCFKTDRYRCFTITYRRGDETFTSLEVPLSREPFQCGIIGDRTDEIKNLIDKERQLAEGGIASERAPMTVLSRLIREETYGSIGGHLQLASAGPYGVILRGTLNPSNAPDGQYFGYKPHRRTPNGETILRSVGDFLVSPPMMIA